MAARSKRGADRVSKVVLDIDGARFDDLDGFYDEVSRQLIPGLWWSRNLNAFNDILRGGFGTPEGGFTLRWLNAARSRERLGFRERVNSLERKLTRCHPTNLPSVLADLERARRGEGETLFDTIVTIIRRHGPGGVEAADNVLLELRE